MDRGSISDLKKKEILLTRTASGSAVMATQSNTKCVPGIFIWGKAAGARS
jgi:hypothetical protein